MATTEAFTQAEIDATPLVTLYAPRGRYLCSELLYNQPLSSQRTNALLFLEPATAFWGGSGTDYFSAIALPICSTNKNRSWERAPLRTDLRANIV